MCGLLVFFSMTMASVIRIFFRTLTGNAADDRPDIGNVISLQNHELEKIAIFIYDTVHNEPNTLI
jgi:hypothetical protein